MCLLILPLKGFIRIAFEIFKCKINKKRGLNLYFRPKYTSDDEKVVLIYHLSISFISVFFIINLIVSDN
jgi:hypothetical protein